MGVFSQEPILWFGGSCLSIAVLTISLKAIIKGIHGLNVFHYSFCISFMVWFCPRHLERNKMCSTNTSSPFELSGIQLRVVRMDAKKIVRLLAVETSICLNLSDVIK